MSKVRKLRGVRRAVAKTGYAPPPPPNPGEFAASRVVILATRWNVEIVDGLLDGARRCLQDWGVPPSAIEVLRVPGAFELPLAASSVMRGSRCDGVIALGVVIRGDTPHFDFVAGECARGLREASQAQGVALGFGVLTVDTVAQARARSTPRADNKGYEAAAAMLEMLRLLRSLRR